MLWTRNEHHCDVVFTPLWQWIVWKNGWHSGSKAEYASSLPSIFTHTSCRYLALFFSYFPFSGRTDGDLSFGELVATVAWRVDGVIVESRSSRSDRMNEEAASSLNHRQFWRTQNILTFCLMHYTAYNAFEIIYGVCKHSWTESKDFSACSGFIAIFMSLTSTSKIYSFNHCSHLLYIDSCRKGL